MNEIFGIVFLLFTVNTSNIDTNKESCSMSEYRQTNLRNDLVLYAENLLGYKYRSKSEKQMLDCSGLVNLMYRKIGKKVQRSSSGLYREGTSITMSEAKPGDIIVFKGRNTQSKNPGHVGLVHHIENDTLYFIHSSVSKGVVIDHVYDPYYKKRLLGIRKVLND